MVAHRMIIMLPLVAIKRLRWNALILWMVHHIIRVTHVRGIRIIFWVIAHMEMVGSLLVHLRIHGRVACLTISWHHITGIHLRIMRDS